MSLSKVNVSTILPTIATVLCSFANAHMMLQYGHILRDFQLNSTLLNQSIFTMMHHVAGECNQPQSLLQASIVQTFISILDTASSKIIPQVRYTSILHSTMQRPLSPGGT
jgi:timeless protein